MVPRHCFLQENGFILFGNERLLATTLIDGEIDPDPAFQADYKILLIEEEHTIQPLPISVSASTGSSVQINYEPNLQRSIRVYESVDMLGSFASRSDLASMATFPGDCGGARFSLNLLGVHSMHQGESEGLKMNDIIQSLMNIRDLHSGDYVGPLARSVLEKVNIVDPQGLSMDASSISLKSHHVRLEGPPRQIPQYVYRWTDNGGAKEAKKRGLSIDPTQPAGSIPTLITNDRGSALRSGALPHYDRLLTIDTTKIPHLTHQEPISSKGGHWQYNITCNIPKEAIQVAGRSKKKQLL